VKAFSKNFSGDRHAMQATGLLNDQIADAPVARDHSAAIGFLIVTAVPAAFWTALAGSVAHLMGSPLSTMTLALTAATIAAFLGTVFAALRSRAA
jgi:hypothetical protein